MHGLSATTAVSSMIDEVIGTVKRIYLTPRFSRLCLVAVQGSPFHSWSSQAYESQGVSAKDATDLGCYRLNLPWRRSSPEDAISISWLRWDHPQRFMLLASTCNAVGCSAPNTHCYTHIAHGWCYGLMPTPRLCLSLRPTEYPRHPKDPTVDVTSTSISDE